MKEIVGGEAEPSRIADPKVELRASRISNKECLSLFFMSFILSFFSCLFFRF